MKTRGRLEGEEAVGVLLRSCMIALRGLLLQLAWRSDVLLQVLMKRDAIGEEIVTLLPWRGLRTGLYLGLYLPPGAASASA
jgi:hypothetical protein